MKLIITVDTEADNQWEKSEISTFKNIEFVPRFQELCNQYGFKPTYLVSYEITESAFFIDMMKPLLTEGKAEVGTHLHPWSCPPFENITPNDSHYHPYTYELPITLFRQKMERLTSALEEAFEVKPITYRAGRWGFAPAHIEVLLSLGYIADCSVTPYLSWVNAKGDPDGKGGPDYSKAPIVPYFLDPHDVCKEGNSKLLEVPLTVILSDRAIAGSFNVLKKINILKRSLVKCGFGPKVFRPALNKTANSLINIYRVAKRLSLPYVHMMVHSSELMPGCSPYHPDNESIEDMYQNLEKVFQYLQSDQVTGITLGDFSKTFISERVNE